MLLEWWRQSAVAKLLEWWRKSAVAELLEWWRVGGRDAECSCRVARVVEAECSCRVAGVVEALKNKRKNRNKKTYKMGQPT